MKGDVDCAVPRRRQFVAAALAGLAAAFAIGAAAAAAAPAAWKPDRAIEFIATNAPGGGSDRIFRIMAKVLQERRYVETPMNVVNKPGGGGIIAYSYLNQHQGNGHHLVLGSKAILSNNIVGNGPSYTEFSPVASLFNEYIAITVRPDSPLKSGRDLIERLKADPGALSLGITNSLGSINHQGAAAAFREAGIDVRKVRTVVFPSGGAAATAMLGGHIDVVSITAAFATSMLRSGQLRLITVTAPRRLPEVLADVPTWREQGYDAVVSNWRVMFGAKGMTEAQAAYWEDVLRRMADSEDWKKELEANFWTADFMGSVETRKHLERENIQARAFLTDLGLAK